MFGLYSYVISGSFTFHNLPPCHHLNLQPPVETKSKGDVIEHLMQKDNKMMNLVTQVRGEGLLGLFQEVTTTTSVTLKRLKCVFPITCYECKIQEKKKFQSSFDNSFLKESKSGNQAIDLFLDRANPYNKVDQQSTSNSINSHHGLWMTKFLPRPPTRPCQT